MSAQDLLHREYSGWFPFYLLDEDVVAPYLVAPVSTRNVSFPLPSYTKAYWLAKSFDYAVNITCSKTESGVTSTGTLIGSGTVTIANPYIDPSTGALLYHPTVPQERTKPGGFSFDGTQLSYAWSITDTAGGAANGTAGIAMAWFDQIALGPCLMTTSAAGSARKYLTVCGLEMTAGVDAGFFFYNKGSGTSPGGSTDSAVNTTLRIDGVVNQTPIILTTDADSASGTLLIDFNSFWT